MKCGICGKEITNHGHNAEPISKERCCDDCNVKVVIPRRISDYKKYCEKVLKNK